MTLKRFLALIALTSIVVCSACSEKKEIETSKSGVEPSQEVNGTINEDEQKENAETLGEELNKDEKETADEDTVLSGRELENQESMQAYEKFLKNDTMIYFDRYIQKDYEDKGLYEQGKGYTLSEILKIVTTHYFENSTNKKMNVLHYGYIDCGKDGVNELVLRLSSLDLYAQDDDSSLVYIMKYIEGKLVLCYYYETWARSESSLNEYGYYTSSGSGGASLHVEKYGLIDKDGKWQFIASLEMESDINQLTWSDELGQLPVVAETKGIVGGIELDTVCFNEVINETSKDKDCVYTFYIYDDNMELIEDENLYTNSKYKEIFDEAMVPFHTPEVISGMILEKERRVGATDEIKKGADITWSELDKTMFSEYVGR